MNEEEKKEKQLCEEMLMKAFLYAQTIQSKYFGTKSIHLDTQHLDDDENDHDTISFSVMFFPLPKNRIDHDSQKFNFDNIYDADKVEDEMKRMKTFAESHEFAKYF